MSAASPALSSMTGFGRCEGSAGDLSWVWEVRSVNGRGLEVRLRLPPGLDAQEAALREATTRIFKRGNVSATLTLRREQGATLVTDRAVLERLLALVQELAERIPGCPPPRAEALLALPGVLRSTNAGDSDAPPTAAFVETFSTALDGLLQSRRSEGARLEVLVRGFLAELSALCRQAAEQATGQPAAQRARMLETLHALLRDAPAGLPPEDRIAQEVALLASRSDVREELDRLDSHLHAAHALLAEGANIGRRLDFLVQEFNREANTLCSKSATTELTATGLRLKAAIEQLREQVQNIE
jgi:uncharacterized protein (TIGR00255 family)